MSKEKTGDILLSWYKSLNEEEEEGIARITVHVIQHDSIEEPSFEEPKKVIIVKKEEDEVITKDKKVSLVSFVITKRIQDLLIRASELSSPYEEDSLERQNIVDKVKKLYLQLGEEIGNL